MDHDLLSLTILLRPLPQAEPGAALPQWWGRAAHRLLLDTVQRADAPLAQALHDGAGLRPFTVSSLVGRFPKGALDAQGLYRLRFTSLAAGLSGLLLQAAQEGPLAPGARLELDYHPFEVVAGSPETAPLCVGYAELSAGLLLAKDPPPRRLALRFLSPTTFKKSGRAGEEAGEAGDDERPVEAQARPTGRGPRSDFSERPAMHLPFPLPDLVFGSLLERWNAFAPVSFPPEARRYAAECLAITRYELGTRPAPIKGGALRVGCVGEVCYTSLNYDRYWMSLLGVLAAFARFAGVGAGASNGLGQCEPVQEG